MKRKFLAVVLSFAMCLTPLTAFAAENETEATAQADGSSVSADELLKKEEEFSKGVSSTSSDMSMLIDLTIGTSQTNEDGETQDFASTINMDMDMHVDAIIDPIKAAVSGSLAMKMDDSEIMSLDLSSYALASEDGTMMDVYTKQPVDETESAWSHVQMDMSEMLAQFGVSSFSELANLSDSDVLGGADMENLFQWEVSEEADTYILSAQVKLGDMSDTIMPLLESSLQSSGEEDASLDAVEPMISMIINGIVMNYSITMDKETCAPTAFHVDFNDSDWSSIESMAQMFMAGYSGESESQPSFSLTFNDFSIDGTYEYDTVTDITVPEEALNAETINMDDLVSEVESEAASEAE